VIEMAKREINKQPHKTPMPEQDPNVRSKNFDEVPLGYSPAEAVSEAKRCLHCKKPKCIDGCPVNIDIKAFIELIQQEDFIGAIHKIKEKNALPAVCGRVCPQEDQCEKTCILGKGKKEPVAIGRLERFAADYEREQGTIEVAECALKTGKKVAIIGAGPAGLTCGGTLANLGYEVTVFEALHKAGGVLVYGIPEFRLPKAIVQAEVDYIIQCGVDIKPNYVIGRVFTIDELFDEGYNAAFIGTGAGLPYFMDIPGENLNGVYSANEFLTRSNLMKAYLFPEYDTPIRVGKNVAVIGGGNVAMDSARTALRLGAEHVYLVYRRSRDEMPARAEEIHHAEEEGIDFRLLTTPIKYLGDEEGNVTSMECLSMELGEPDDSGRRRPVPVEGSEHMIDVDVVVVAIGQGANPLIQSTTKGLETNRRGYIVADPDTLATSRPGVYAGGDIVTGAATVIQAMGAGQKAANSIHEFLSGDKSNEK
jgi:glutamate synthase (NADPH/NADH) small chain